MPERFEDIDPDHVDDEQKLRRATPKDQEDLTVEEVLLKGLDPLIKDELLLGAIRTIKSGKEAVVYLCRAHPSIERDLVAAKIYRPHERRSFRKDGVYQQGRERGSRPDAREMRSLSRKTRGGLVRKFHAWISHEMKTLEVLYAAGASVPEPIHRQGPVVVMEYIGDSEHPAPVLVNLPIEPDEAKRLYAEVLRNVDLFLKNHRVHADLSAYNMLLWDDRLVIIDFPQAVDPRYNEDAFDLLIRDITNVNGFFVDHGVEVIDPITYALEIWRAHVDRNR